MKEITITDWTKILKKIYEEKGPVNYDFVWEDFPEWTIEYNTSKSVRHPNAEKVMDENVRGTYW